MSDDNAGKLTRLEEEGEIAADYLEELLDIADLDGDIEIDVENGRASVEIVADDPERSRLMLDIAGFRAERKEELQDITREAIARVRSTGEAVKLDAMNPFERKVCHDVVAEEGLTSESEGAEPHRRVVILPEESDGE